MDHVMAQRNAEAAPDSPLVARKTTCDFTGYKCPAVKAAQPGQALLAARGNCGISSCLGIFTPDQLVSTSGENAYQKPGPTDIRGPCPGLNAAANHGYLYRTGTPDRANTIAGLNAAFGMGVDLAEALAELSIAQFGDEVSGRWSIGGPVPNVAVNTPLNTGISYAHNNYESDASIVRCDAYLNNGDAHSVIVSRFTEMYESRLVAGRGAVPGNMADSGYTLDSFAQDYLCKSQWSIDTNPIYVSAPFAGTLVAPAAYNFVINSTSSPPRNPTLTNQNTNPPPPVMSNHSATNPEGWLSPSVFKSFFAITGDYPNFTWLPGQERIPENCYPDALRLGCNNGKVGTYVQGDPSGVLGELGSVDPDIGAIFMQPAGTLPANCPGVAYNPRGLD
ncbi:hypothetical protein PRZ48_011057 [Zasmidium cellare]|uniref:Heme haloperoxidase family profile domain-containing protein n=1 Tax=Zasmidium cellare TaxID=395010 RepID=A0ABR0EAC3_ZASCE|nr:hypothetical protein PRZ48_011057 [Zasmidium cellare]